MFQRMSSEDIFKGCLQSMSSEDVLGGYLQRVSSKDVFRRYLQRTSSENRLLLWSYQFKASGSKESKNRIEDHKLSLVVSVGITTRHQAVIFAKRAVCMWMARFITWLVISSASPFSSWTRCTITVYL